MKKKADPGLSYAVLSQYRGELMGFAMLWIMLFHAFYMTPETAWVKNLKDIGYFGVDIFIFLSSLGLSISLSRKKQSYGAYLKRRLVRVLPTYWLVTGVYGLALYFVGRTSRKTILWTVSTLFYWFGKPNYFNWYIPALLFFYLLAPLCVALLSRINHKEIVTAGLCLLVLPLSWAMQSIGLGHITRDLVPRLPVFLMGTLIGGYIVQDRILTPRRLWVWAALPFLVPVIKNLAGDVFSSRCFSFAFGCVAVCLLLSGLAAILPQWLREALRLLGACSLEIYLLNVVFVLEYGTLSGFIPSGENHSIYYTITIIANILLGITLHYLLKKPMAWLTEKVTGSGSLSRPPKGEGYSAEDPSGR